MLLYASIMCTQILCALIYFSMLVNGKHSQHKQKNTQIFNYTWKSFSACRKLHMGASGKPQGQNMSVSCTIWLALNPEYERMNAYLSFCHTETDGSKQISISQWPLDCHCEQKCDSLQVFPVIKVVCKALAFINTSKWSTVTKKASFRELKSTNNLTFHFN